MCVGVCMTTVCACVNAIVLALACFLEAKRGDCPLTLLLFAFLIWDRFSQWTWTWIGIQQIHRDPVWCWGYKDRQPHLALHVGFKSDLHACTLSLSFNSFSSGASSSFFLTNCKMRSLEILMPTKPFIARWCQKVRGLFSGIYIFIESWLLSSSVPT